MSSSANSRIAFIQGDNHPTHTTVSNQLRLLFPESEIATFNVRQLLRDHPGFVLANLLQTIRVYGIGRLIRRRDPVDCFIQTPAAFAFIKKLLGARINAAEFDFSFQTYSMWDGSVPGLPHFVYTDNTELGTLGYPGYNRSHLIGPWWTKLETSIYHNAAVVFTMGANVARVLVDQYGCPGQKVRCVGVGCNAPMPERWNNDLGRYRQKIILFVGTVWKNKGGPELVSAFRRVLENHPTAHLRIVGCGVNPHVRNCHVLGRIALDSVRREYENASLFCLPTWRESFGISYIEAMSAGLPVVGSDFGAIPDFIINGENGFRVRPGDVEGLARVLSQLLDDPQKMQAFGDASARRARRNYTWEIVGHKIKAAIVEILASRGHADRARLPS